MKVLFRTSTTRRQQQTATIARKAQVGPKMVDCLSWLFLAVACVTCNAELSSFHKTTQQPYFSSGYQNQQQGQPTRFWWQFSGQGQRAQQPNRVTQAPSYSYPEQHFPNNVEEERADFDDEYTQSPPANGFNRVGDVVTGGTGSRNPDGTDTVNGVASSSLQTSAPLKTGGDSTGHLAAATLGAILASPSSPPNLIISPFSIWTVLVMLYDVAAGRTAAQLANLLRIPEQSAARQAFSAIQKQVTSSASPSASEVLFQNFVIRQKTQRLKPEFDEKLRTTYKAKLFDLQAGQNQGNAATVNSWIAQATNYRINQAIIPSDFSNFTVVVGNVGLFKGKWKFPFNKTSFSDEFLDERGKALGSVPMMTAKLTLNYSFSTQLGAQIVEIPYADDKTSMVVILPKKRTSITNIFDTLKRSGLSQTLSELSPEDVDLYLPRFKIVNNFALNAVLVSLGVSDMLTDGAANLPGLAPRAYVSRVTHQAEIENNEEGTTASAVTTAQLSYKTSLVSFHANKPFIYLIVDSKSKAVLFAGVFRNPRA